MNFIAVNLRGGRSVIEQPNFIKEVGRVYGLTFDTDYIEIEIFKINEFRAFRKCSFSYKGRKYTFEKSKDGNLHFSMQIYNSMIELDMIDRRW